MAKTPVDEAVGGLMQMADASHAMRLKKLKGLLDRASAEADALAGEEAKEPDEGMSDDELNELDAELG